MAAPAPRVALAALSLALTLPVGLGAQSTAGDGATGAAGATEEAADIVAEDLRRRVRLLAADSMRGRDTPGPQLVQAARHLAARFESFGVKPGLGRQGYLQWYPVTVVEPADPGEQGMRLSGPGGQFSLRHGREFVALPTGTTVTAAGRLALREAGEGSVTGDAIAVVRSGPDSFGRALRELRGTLDRSGVLGAVIAVDGSRSWFERVGDYLGGHQVSLGRPSGLSKPVALVREVDLPEGLTRALEGEGSVGRWSARLTTASTIDSARAPNVVGWIEGSDPSLRSEYVVVSAHLDGLGVGEPVDGDSIYNGADDNATGTAAVLEMAEAFGATTPPRRSVVFLAVSGEEKGLFGSRWYVEHPVFSLERTVANVNIDMIGRNWRDTAVAIGQDLSTLGETVQRVAAEHPELGLTVVEDRWPEENFFSRSDHYVFARNGVPALFFFSGVHEDYHRPSDEADEVDYGKTARITRLIYRLIREVADAPEAPRWDPEAHDRVVEDGERR